MDQSGGRNLRPKFHPNPSYQEIRRFYDHVFHGNVGAVDLGSGHLRKLAGRFAPWRGKKLLDVGCGTGRWLIATSELGAITTGIDISEVALGACRRTLRRSALLCGTAENLPFTSEQFDFVSCLGSLEHFVNPEKALREMVRVARPGAKFLLLVPNADFLPRRLGLYRGTEQVKLRELVLSLSAWNMLFESVGLRVLQRWEDLHVLSWSWINRGRIYLRPLRALQALFLPLWPLAWQYQVYHLCEIRE